MSAAPYLSKLRKTDLTEMAETSKLTNYKDLKKSDLETALDDHLRANQSTYENEASLTEYYKRLGARSPARKVSDVVKSEGDPIVKKARRKTQVLTEQIAGAASDAGAKLESKTTALIKTPARDLAKASSSLVQRMPMPPSPAAVTDAIDRQTRRFSASVSNLYDQSGVVEYSDSVRDVLSSPITITALFILVEAFGLRKEILPSKAIGDIPPIPYIKADKTTVFVPDLFLLLNSSFWGPFSLWSLTSLIIPLAIAYYINLPLKHTPGHGHATRRAMTLQAIPSLQIDPLVFNVAKALTAYLVYADHFNFMGTVPHFTIATVNESVYGGYNGIITSSAVAGLISLYEAVLKK